MMDFRVAEAGESGVVKALIGERRAWSEAAMRRRRIMMTKLVKKYSRLVIYAIDTNGTEASDDMVVFYCNLPCASALVIP